MKENIADYWYLHGFASSPHSAKAQFLRDRFHSRHLDLIIPDFNQGDFSHLTLTRQLQHVRSQFNQIPTTIIGSSFGGLTAAWLGEWCQQVDRLVLLAPAFQFLTHWLPRLGTPQVQQWQREQYLSVYHYGEQRMLPLHYNFVTDAAQYDEAKMTRSVPTLILHGIHDDVIPIESSRSFAASRPWVQLIELESDHALTDVRDQIWEAIEEFLEL